MFEKHARCDWLVSLRPGTPGRRFRVEGSAAPTKNLSRKRTILGEARKNPHPLPPSRRTGAREEKKLEESSRSAGSLSPPSKNRCRLAESAHRHQLFATGRCKSTSIRFEFSTPPRIGRVRGNFASSSLLLDFRARANNPPTGFGCRGILKRGRWSQEIASVAERSP